MPAGIAIYGQEILITNNTCSDSTVPSKNASQLYGLAIHKDSKNIMIGSDVIYPNSFVGPSGDIYDTRPTPVERLKSYDEYLRKIDELKPY